MICAPRAAQMVPFLCFCSQLLFLVPACNGFSLSTTTQRTIPVTIISGFLGSGKTSLLQHLLLNDEGLNIAVIVNDVAEINIDSKLIAGQTAASLSPPYEQNSNQKQNKTPTEIVQLSNGCACCSIADELLPSVTQLVTLSDMNRDATPDNSGGFDHIVIELSGVASPKAIRAKFQEAEYYGMPLMDRVQLDTMVTVVDCSSFLMYLQSDNGRRVNQDESPELFFRDAKDMLLLKDNQNDNELENYWSSLESYSPETATISQLITEQTETSDVILINKIDMLLPDNNNSLKNVENIVSALNSRAKIFKTSFSVVDRLSDVLGAARGLGVAGAGIGDEHRELIDTLEEKMHCKDNKNDFDTTCMDLSHEHTEHTRDNSHDHIHDNDPSFKQMETCTVPNCTDETHSHAHTHCLESHAGSNHGQIGTYIYRARRPFHPSRLIKVLRMMPIIRGLPPQSDHDDSSIINHDKDRRKVFKSIVRSKGFAWLAHSHIAAMYWSHAGSSFEMQCLGRWWATLERYHWPEEAVDDILKDFDDVHHDDMIVSDLTSVGDRRQEIVLIGESLGSPERQQLLKENLDACLLTDDEFELYKQLCIDEDALSARFENSIKNQMMSF